MLISMNAVIVILFQIPLTRRIEKFKPMVMMAIGSGLFAIGYLSLCIYQQLLTLRTGDGDHHHW